MMTASPAVGPAVESLIERLARRGIRLKAPLRPAPLTASPARARRAATVRPPRIVLGDEAVWGAVAPALWVEPAKAIAVVRKKGRRPSTIH